MEDAVPEVDMQQPVKVTLQQWPVLKDPAPCETPGFLLGFIGGVVPLPDAVVRQPWAAPGIVVPVGAGAGIVPAILGVVD